jgi:hypothetical protein
MVGAAVPPIRRLTIHHMVRLLDWESAGTWAATEEIMMAGGHSGRLQVTASGHGGLPVLASAWHGRQAYDSGDFDGPTFRFSALGIPAVTPVVGGKWGVAAVR